MRGSASVPSRASCATCFTCARSRRSSVERRATSSSPTTRFCPGVMPPCACMLPQRARKDRRAASVWWIWALPTGHSCSFAWRFLCRVETSSASGSSFSGSTSTRRAAAHDDGGSAPVTQPETPAVTPGAGGSREASAARGEIRVRLFARTDVGQIREHNEDNFLVADLTRKTRGLLESNRTSVVGPHGSLFAVCDGMGGAAAGEIASQLGVDILYERMVEGLQEGHTVSRDELARRLVRAIEAAGLRIFQEAKLDRTRRGMGTTVTAAALVDDHLFFAQVGDSRGYILRSDQLVQLTRDQSLVNQLIEAGRPTEEEA